jgi:gamma-glutamylcysteine synthetase
MEDRGMITINRRGVFSLEEARRILPVVRRITLEFSAKVELLIARLETLQLNQTETICALEKQVNELIQSWNDKIRKLGADPRGLWATIAGSIPRVTFSIGIAMRMGIRDASRWSITTRGFALTSD